MVDNRKKKSKNEIDLDLLVDLLLARVRNQTELRREIEKLKKEILTDAEIVARWNRKSFYIS